MSDGAQVSTAKPDVPDQGDGDLVARKGRNSAVTRRALIRAALHRFATTSYHGATVRQIAADAGVNGALIKRYFGSKEGLFNACMQQISDDMDTPTHSSNPSDVIRQLVGDVLLAPDGKSLLKLTLMLRPTADAGTEAFRRRTLEQFTHRLATVVGWKFEDPATETILLRAQLATAIMLGVITLRASPELEPISSVSSDAVTALLSQTFQVLLVDYDR